MEILPRDLWPQIMQYVDIASFQHLICTCTFMNAMKHDHEQWFVHAKIWQHDNPDFMIIDSDDESLKISKCVVSLSLNLSHFNYAFSIYESDDDLLIFDQDWAVIYIPQHVRILKINVNVDYFDLPHCQHLSCTTLNFGRGLTCQTLCVESLVFSEFDSDSHLWFDFHEHLIVRGEMVLYDWPQLSALDFVCNFDHIHTWLAHLTIPILTIRQCDNLHIQCINSAIRHIRLIGQNVIVNETCKQHCHFYHYDEHDDNAHYYAKFISEIDFNHSSS